MSPAPITRTSCAKRSVLIFRGCATTWARWPTKGTVFWSGCCDDAKIGSEGAGSKYVRFRPPRRCGDYNVATTTWRLQQGARILPVAVHDRVGAQIGERLDGQRRIE